MEGSKTRRPEVFISATSEDLGACRQVIKESLLTMGCVPVEQTNFGPDGGNVKDMLRSVLAGCDAVIHVAGLRYGAEPQNRTAEEPRRSYTQLEYEIARELKRPVYVFVCGDDFPYSACDPESELFQELQLQHRRNLLSGDELYEEVNSTDSLALRIHALQDRVNQLAKELARTRSWLGRGLTIGIVALAVLGGGLWWLSDRTDQTAQQLAAVQTEMETQRDYIRGAAAAFLEVKTQLAELDLTDEQLWQKALTRTAQSAGIPILELEASIALFVAVIGQQDSASALDKAYAMFAQGEFQSAGDLAVLATEELQRQRVANRQLAIQANLADQEIQKEQREAFRLVAQARRAQGNYAEAVAAYRSALDPQITSREEQPLAWAGLQGDFGRAANQLANYSEGSDIHEHLQEAVDAYHLALTVINGDSYPKAWASIQASLAIAFDHQAAIATGDQRALLYAKSIATYRLILETVTRESDPKRWSNLLKNLGIALRHKADDATGTEALQLLTEAIEAYRLTLQVQTREAYPMDWAGTQANIAIVLGRLAEYSSPEERKRLHEEALITLRLVLEVENREQEPLSWANAQNSLGVGLSALSRECADERREQLLKESAQAYRLALEIRTRESSPREWAATQNNLAIILEDQANITAGQDSARFLDEAVRAYRCSLEVYSRETLPADWAKTQSNLASLLIALALASQDEAQQELFQQAEDGLKSSLEVYTQKAFAQDWSRTHYNLALLYRHRATYSEGSARANFMGQSAQSIRNVLEVDTRETESFRWAELQTDLALTYSIQAQSCQGEERLQLIERGIDAMQLSMEVWTKEDAPDMYQERAEWIDEQLAELNAAQK